MISCWTNEKLRLGHPEDCVQDVAEKLLRMRRRWETYWDMFRYANKMLHNSFIDSIRREAVRRIYVEKYPGDGFYDDPTKDLRIDIAGVLSRHFDPEDSKAIVDYFGKGHTLKEISAMHPKRQKSQWHHFLTRVAMPILRKELEEYDGQD